MKANDALAHHAGSDKHYRYIIGTHLTEGARELSEKFGCFWLLDIIASYQPELRKKGEVFQVWELKKNADDSAVVTCGDGNGNRLVEQEIPYTDFRADEAVLWCVEDVILLPSEY